MNKYILIPVFALCGIALIILLNNNKTSSGERINERLAWIYEAEKNAVSDFDVKILLRWGEYGQKWNLATAPIIREYMDQEVSAEDFLLTSNTQLKEIMSIVYEMGVDSNMIQDTAVRERLRKIFDIHKEGIEIYQALHDAVSTLDEQKQKDTLKRLESWGKNKTSFVKPTIDRLVQKLPNDVVDKTMNRMRNEVSESLRK